MEARSHRGNGEIGGGGRQAQQHCLVGYVSLSLSLAFTEERGISGERKKRA